MEKPPIPSIRTVKKFMEAITWLETRQVKEIYELMMLYRADACCDGEHYTQETVKKVHEVFTRDL